MSEDLKKEKSGIQADAHEAARPGKTLSLRTHEVGGYGMAATGLPADPWKGQKKAWIDTREGKTVVEFISRMTLGSIFFSLMDTSSLWKINEYDPNKKISEHNIPFKLKLFFYPARWVDNTFGKLISGTVNALGGDGNDAIKFRQTTSYRKDDQGHNVYGRTLGPEAVVVTASFAAMSAGTGIMRAAINGIFSPTERATYLKEGKFNLSHAGKRALWKSWEIASKNVGEDVAVAIPYVYFMRVWRSVVSWAYPGFKVGSDRVDNGGSFLVDDKGNITGTLRAAGMLDLQARFTVYNVFTQIYRDIYDWLGSIFKRGWEAEQKGWSHAASYAKSTIEPVILHPLNTAKRVTRYLLISSIRSILQMTPTVPFFSFFRVSQGPAVGLAVHPRKGSLAFWNEETGNWNNIFAHNSYYNVNTGRMEHDTRFDTNELVYFTRTGKSPADGAKIAAYNPFGSTHDSDGNIVRFDYYGQTKPGKPLEGQWFSSITDGVGRFSENLSESVNPFYTRALWKNIKPNKNAHDYSRMTRSMVYAGEAYAPYFSAKVFFRESFVNEQMNMAIGRALDGIWKLNLGEVTAGMEEIWSTMRRQPLADASRRQQIAQYKKENPNDNSPGDPLLEAQEALSNAWAQARKQPVASYVERLGRQEPVQWSAALQPRQESHVSRIEEGQSQENIPPGTSIH